MCLYFYPAIQNTRTNINTNIYTYMARLRTPLLLLLLVAVFLHHAAATGRKVCGRVQVKNVEDNKDVQELGRYCVREYNRRKANGSITTYAAAALEFSRVVEAETQVVSGIKYYLKISAACGGVPKTFEAVVVVKPWLHSKDLLDFAPSQPHLTTTSAK